MDVFDERKINITPHGIVVDGVTEQSRKHTDDIQEIIIKVPSWIVRWGITLFFAILLILVAISVLVRYPDMVETPIKIVASGSTTSVINTEPAKIVSVFVKKNQRVSKGQPLVKVISLTDGKTSVLTTKESGIISFATIVQAGIVVQGNHLMFQVHPINEQYFGIVNINDNNIHKVKEGQDVLINLGGYPPGQYVPLKGKITFITDEPLNNGSFMAKVTLENERSPALKNWMTGTAKIVTEDVSLKSRILNNMVKGIK